MNATTYLITGLPGSGKSTVISELSRRGYNAVDTDNEVYSYTKDGEWVLRDDEMPNLIHSSTSSVLFVSAIAANQSDYYELFDTIFLLEIDAKTMQERLSARRGNDYGKTPEELQKALSDHAKIQDILKKHATAIDAIRPIDEVIGQILERL